MGSQFFAISLLRHQCYRPRIKKIHMRVGEQRFYFDVVLLISRAPQFIYVLLIVVLPEVTLTIIFA